MAVKFLKLTENVSQCQGQVNQVRDIAVMKQGVRDLYRHLRCLRLIQKTKAGECGELDTIRLDCNM